MTLTLQLPDEKEAALCAKARARGVSTEEYACQVLVHDIDDAPQPHRPVWESIAEIMRDVPSEDLAALPKDGLNQIDHYVYGVPKTTH